MYERGARAALYIVSKTPAKPPAETFVADGSWDGTVNTPQLVTGMTPVAWDSTNSEFTPTTNADWYSYTAQPGTTPNGGTSKWANAKTTNGSYLTWIPRYAYKITNGYHGYNGTAGSGTLLASGTSGTIDIKFLQGTSNNDMTGTDVTTQGYKIPPAFTNNPNNGGWDSEIAGIWVGKYDASQDGNGEVKIVPNAASWVSTLVSGMFAACQAFDTNNNLSGMDSHMMKNSEWGAVAYLAQSQYGRNGTEVTINNYYVGSTIKTGYGGGSVSAAQDTTGNNSYAYNTVQGQLASTTGNITGVYDMSGGAYDYTAAYVYNGNASLTTYCSNLLTAAAKYKDVYSASSTSGTDTQATNYPLTSGKYGDAIYETSPSSASPYTNSWFSDTSNMPYAARPVFLRGRQL